MERRLPGVWIVYSRSGCSLCEAFIVELAHLLGEAGTEVQVADIESDPKVFKRYSDRIPVLTVDDELVCAIRVDHDRVRRHMTVD
jgi:Glutaredoxin-like domain (DUF836)